MLYHIKQGDKLEQCLTKCVLDRDIQRYKQSHPLADDEEVMRFALKHELSSNMPGSPRWHGEQLADLITMFKERGMPNFFLTLTSDEISELRWPEIDDLERVL
jgi:hypothetical protein